MTTGRESCPAHHVTPDQIRAIPLPPSTDINAWIDAEISKAARGTSIVSRSDAGEIARGAALTVIADVDTLIKNLRRIGYTVLEPLSGQDELR